MGEGKYRNTEPFIEMTAVDTTGPVPFSSLSCFGVLLFIAVMIPDRNEEEREVLSGAVRTFHLLQLLDMLR